MRPKLVPLGVEGERVLYIGHELPTTDRCVQEFAV
jgi:hypothetical protein